VGRLTCVGELDERWVIIGANGRRQDVVAEFAAAAEHPSSGGSIRAGGAPRAGSTVRAALAGGFELLGAGERLTGNEVVRDWSSRPALRGAGPVAGTPRTSTTPRGSTVLESSWAPSTWPNAPTQTLSEGERKRILMQGR